MDKTAAQLVDFTAGLRYSDIPASTIKAAKADRPWDFDRWRSDDRAVALEAAALLAHPAQHVHHAAQPIHNRTRQARAAHPVRRREHHQQRRDGGQ